MVTINDQQFIAIDWGTSHYRMYLVNSDAIQVLSNLTSHEGIKYMHQQCEFSRQERDSFYLDFLEKKLSTLSKSLNGKEAIIISGMASSSIGMRCLPYATLPFGCSGSDIVLEEVSANTFTNRIFLISGVRANEDVMRGEETQLLGLTDSIESDEYIMILPGTHSKHVFINQGQVVDFKTYMTGEIFDILGKHSILKESIMRGVMEQTEEIAFRMGVDHSQGSALLNELFRIRSRDLFRISTRKENYYYLSGLLLGQELSNLRNSSSPLYLAATGHLAQLYQFAGQQLNLAITFLKENIVEKAAIIGQLKILRERILA